MKPLKLLALSLVIWPGWVFALGLGNLDISSALNEPLVARIELLSVTAEELDSLIVGLADNQAFSRAGIERPFLLSQLKFTLQRPEEGPNYIRLSSQVPIMEPFLNFLVEANWSKGRLFREYTVLLDPPLYAPEVGIKESISSAPIPTDAQGFDEEGQADEAVQVLDETERQVVDFDAFDRQTGAAPSIAYAGGDYGPAQSSDTLWSIASAVRPDGISVNKMMLALLRTNPNAFINQNINGLKRGQILSMPPESELTRLSSEEILAEINSQHALWDDVKNTMTAQVAEQPVVSSGSETPADEAERAVATATESEPELKLVTASTAGEAVSDQATGGDPSGSTVSAGLTLARESIQALTQENMELKDRLQESEILIEDLKRFITLKDDELASLQSQFAQQEAMADEAAEGMEQETMTDEAAEGMEQETMTDEAAEGMEQETMTDEAAEGMEQETMTDEAAEGMEQETMTDEAAEGMEQETMTDEAAEGMEQETMTDEAAEGMEQETMTDEAADEVEQEAMTGEAAEDVEGVAMVEDAAAESSPAATGIMGIVNTYLTPIKEIVMGNLMIAGGVLVALIIGLVFMKFRKGSAEVIEIDTQAAAEFSNAHSSAGSSTGIDVEYTEQSSADSAHMEDSDSEAVTDVPVSDGGIPEQALSSGEDTQIRAAMTDEEQDPLQEVNTYLAFEQFGQAEEFVRNVIKRSPDNPEGHVKLLEVFYTSGNKQAYEESARTLHNLVGGQGEYWDMAVAMWSEMSPNRALFEEGADDESATVETGTGGGIVDIATDAEGDDNALDFDIGPDEAEQAVEPIGTTDDENVLELDAGDNSALDFDIGLDEVGEAEEPTDEGVLALDSSDGLGDSLDMTDLSAEESDLDLTMETALDEEEALLDMTDADANSDDGGTIEFDMVDSEAGIAEEDNQDNVIDFDVPAVSDSAPEDDVALSLDMEDLAESNESDGLSLDVADGDASDDDGLELDLTDINDKGMDFDLDETGSDGANTSDDLAFENTVEMPKPESLDQEEDDGDGDTTVFVPRSSTPDEQSAEDEIATKLDLAKAYVELEDKSSAKTILDEVIAEGNDAQKKQAADLLSQVQ